jgi:NAD(P)-dependent dehydrogenase (short-subunit alcohol dehydrogenase family)
MHILITGGNKGIGLESAKLFLKAGWQVTVLARNATALELDCTKHDVDLTDIEAIKDLPALVGDVDAIVNNAGIMHVADFRKYSDEKKQSILKLNLEAPIEIMTVFADSLKKRGGRIINVGSIAGETGHPDIWYGVTKAGLVNATKSFAKFLGPEVPVNAVAPGPVNTGMIHTVPAERLEAMKKNAATGRVAEVGEVACLIFWLATDAPKQITGSVIDINGGAYAR